MAAVLYKWLLVTGFCLPVEKTEISKLNIQGVNIHPFYISVTEFNQNAKDNTLEISCKMFAEDLEQILEKNYKKQLDISLDKDKANFDKYIPDYVSKHLVLVIDGKAVKLSYVGYETERESAYCYFQIDGIATLKKIDITNSILQDFNQEQINIMHVVVNGIRKSLKLNYPEKNASFSF